MRLKYLDGLRGIACLQVLLLHVFTGYFPGLVDSDTGAIASFIKNSPLFFFYDGFAGVYIFFYISGYVLTGAFETFKFHWLDEMQARIIRLWVPTICFGIWALVLFIIFHRYHTELAAINGSDWLGHCWSVDKSPRTMFQDIFVTPLFAGYQNSPIVSLFPDMKNYLTDSGTAFNSPVWTMSVELQGSFLILLSVYLRKKVPVLWAALMVCIIGWLPSQYDAFVIGHIAAALQLGKREYRGWYRAIHWLAIPLVIIGVLIAWPHRSDFFLLIGTGLIFLGIINSPFYRNILSHRIIIRLGELSFTIYLLHWAVIFGPGSWIVLKMIPLIGFQVSLVIGAALVIFAVFFISSRLYIIDKASIALAHKIKHGQRLNLESTLKILGEYCFGLIRLKPPN